MIALAALRMIDPPPLEELRLRTFDFFQLAAPREASAHPAVIVDIDEESLKALGQWPWPRTVIADLVDRLAGLGAAAIGFDVLRRARSLFPRLPHRSRARTRRAEPRTHSRLAEQRSDPG
jgi:CHASE2 domain-containing sensor protein